MGVDREEEVPDREGMAVSSDPPSVGDPSVAMLSIPPEQLLLWRHGIKGEGIATREILRERGSPGLGIESS